MSDISTHGIARITAKQEQAIDLLLAGSSIVDAAREIGVNESTVRRWMKDATFTQEYDTTRKRLLNHSLTSLQLKFDKAVRTLDRHLEAVRTIPRDQIKAAEVVVDKTIQTAKLVERIAELEALLGEHEQATIYIVTFDLRKLTKDERRLLETINDNLTSRETEYTQQERVSTQIL